MTVNELFKTEKLDIDFIKQHFEGFYWCRADLFIRQHWNMKIEDLSEKQQEWLKRLFDDLTEARIEKGL